MTTLVLALALVGMDAPPVALPPARHQAPNAYSASDGALHLWPVGTNEPAAVRAVRRSDDAGIVRASRRASPQSAPCTCVDGSCPCPCPHRASVTPSRPSSPPAAPAPAVVSSVSTTPARPAAVPLVRYYSAPVVYSTPTYGYSAYGGSGSYCVGGQCYSGGAASYTSRGLFGGIFGRR